MIKTAESVSPKHPDKLCDQASDAILDALIEQDPKSRCAIEVMGGHGKAIVMGEVTTKADIDYKGIVQRVTGLKSVEVVVEKQSPFIAQGVDAGGAGDQGIMVGYACSENKGLVPQEHYLARSLCKYIYKRHPFDGKTQISIKEDKCDIVASFQNVASPALKNLVEDWANQILPQNKMSRLFINPSGDWTQGGFDADTGLTGRKIVVDAYGARVPVGGGAFSGKDLSKVDRAGAYFARKKAVELLKNYNANEVLIKVAYAIGVKLPVELKIRINKENAYHEIPHWLYEEFSADKIRNKIKVSSFEETAKWGHFGNWFSWDIS